MTSSLPTGVDPAIEDQASCADRDWFAAQPTRRFHLRPRVPGELGDNPFANWVLVEQLQPGIRLRHLVYLAGSLPLDNDDELGLMAASGGYSRSGGAVFTIKDGHVLTLEDWPSPGEVQ